MFPKNFFIFGLLALFSCQATNAGSLSALELRNEQSIQYHIIDDLIDHIKEIVKCLQGLMFGVLADAIASIINIGKTVEEIKDLVLGDGITVITNILGECIEYISNRTAEAICLGVDISVCIVGRTEQITQLDVELARNLTTCVTNIAGDVLATVHNKLKVLIDIGRNITALPFKLLECMISLRPITCLLQFRDNTSKMLAELPGQIAEMVAIAMGLVTDLPVNLGECVANISESARNQTYEIIEEIGTCVDDAIANSTTTSSTTTEASTTESSTEASTSSTAAPTDAPNAFAIGS